MVAVAEDGKAHFANEDVDSQDGEDISVIYTDVHSGRRVGKAKFFSAEPYDLVVVFDPQGRVIGKTLYEFRSDWTFYAWLRSQLGI
jgi:hypothetical protein